MTPSAAESGPAVDVAHIDDLLANVNVAAGCGLRLVLMGMYAWQSQLKNVVGVIGCVPCSTSVPRNIIYRR